MPDFDEIRKVFADTYSRLLSPLTFFIAIACWLIAVLAGPFGTFDAMGWELRAFYWFVIVTGAIVVGFGVRAATVLLVGQARPLLFDLTAAALMTVVFAPVVIVMRHSMARISEGLNLNEPFIVFNTFVLSVAVFVLRRQVSPHEPGGYLLDESGAAPAPAAPRLLRRLSPEVAGEILRLSACDHHVEVHTVNGHETLRLRLTDAIGEMEPVRGYCTHRSHWVARGAITGVERTSAHKLFVVLRNGDRVPVSRKYRPELEAAGIIATD